MKTTQKWRVVSALVLLFFGISLFSGRVSQPRYGDYVGLEKSEALTELQQKKTMNTIKMVVSIITFGYLVFIPMPVNVIRAIRYGKDFDSVQRGINSTPDGSRVGTNPVPANTNNAN